MAVGDRRIKAIPFRLNRLVSVQAGFRIYKMETRGFDQRRI